MVLKEIRFLFDFCVQTFWENVGPPPSIGGHPDFGQARVERVHQGSTRPEQKPLDGFVIKSVETKIERLQAFKR